MDADEPTRGPSRGDRERAKWDARHGAAGPLASAEVPFLDAVAPLLPRQGRALDLASGRGRVALWLLRHGLRTSACDLSPVGVALAREAAARAGYALDVVVKDLEAEPPPAGPFDVITCFDYLDLALYQALEAHLAPGGLVAVEVATVTNLERSARPSRRFLVEPGQLRDAFARLELLRYDEGWFGERHVARLLARRPRTTDLVEP